MCDNNVSPGDSHSIQRHATLLTTHALALWECVREHLRATAFKARCAYQSDSCEETLLGFGKRSQRPHWDHAQVYFAPDERQVPSVKSAHVGTKWLHGLVHTVESAPAPGTQSGDPQHRARQTAPAHPRHRRCSCTAAVLCVLGPCSCGTCCRAGGTGEKVPARRHCSALMTGAALRRV